MARAYIEASATDKGMFDMRSPAFDFALKAMDVLGEADLMILPQEPSNYMCMMGAEIAGVDPFTAKKMYRAMLAAAIEHAFED